MQIGPPETTARWQALKAELAATRSQLAAAMEQINEQPAPDANTSETAIKDTTAAKGLAELRTSNATLTSANRRLRTAIKSEHGANAAKTKFLAAASHDLRQPLQAMAALQALLAQSARDKGSKLLIDKLDTSLIAIGSLLDTLLDKGRVEEGTASIDIQSLSLETLFARLAEMHGLTAEADGTELVFAPASAIVASDPLLLQQMLSNLIGNALHYAPEGKVLVGVRPRGGTVVIEIWDNGIGIAAEDADTIFEAYKQVDADDGHAGHGLGLSIVKSLGLLLGHAVALRSVPGSGSVFSVEVPLAPPEAAPAPIALPPIAPPQPQPAGKAVVVHVIDDDDTVLESVAALITAAGHVVQCHGSAEAFVRDWAPDRAACLLVDAALPGEGGLSLLRRLKAQGTMPPTIILTGQGDIATAAAAMRLGTLDFIEKPAPPTDLLTAIDNALAIDETQRLAVKNREAARTAIQTLTRRERGVLDLLLDGHPNKNIGADLGISQRTVENHRAAIMRKTRCRSLPALVRLAIAAELDTETQAR
jgi:two-component system CheB/CheR fusion protein